MSRIRVRTVKSKVKIKCNKYVLRFHHKKNVLSSKPIAAKRSKSVCFSDVMFVTFSIWAFLFECIEQEDQVPHIHKKGMQQNRRLHTTIWKRLDLDILIWKDFMEDQFLHVKKNPLCIFFLFCEQMLRKFEKPNDFCSRDIQRKHQNFS